MTNRFYITPRFFLCLMCCLVLVLTGCDMPTSYTDEREPSVNLTNPITMPFFITNGYGSTPTQPSSYVYESRRETPVKSPDGVHLTWADFSTVQGTAQVECGANGTFIEVELTGLIPNGVYTLWNVTFNAPGMDPSKEMLNINGMGVVGPADGSENGFVASAQGTARISTTTAGGTLSMVGDMGHCALTDEAEWHLVGSYHLDHQTHGPDLGPAGTAVEQFGFIYKRPSILTVPM